MLIAVAEQQLFVVRVRCGVAGPTCALRCGCCSLFACFSLFVFVFLLARGPVVQSRSTSWVRCRGRGEEEWRWRGMRGQLDGCVMDRAERQGSHGYCGSSSEAQQRRTARSACLRPPAFSSRSSIQLQGGQTAQTLILRLHSASTLLNLRSASDCIASVMLAPRAAATGSSGSSGSVFLLSRLLPHARHCFVSLPAGTFAAQLASRGSSAQRHNQRALRSMADVSAH